MYCRYIKSSEKLIVPVSPPIEKAQGSLYFYSAIAESSWMEIELNNTRAFSKTDAY